VDDTSNWKPDPFGTHELRYFSADGRPTLLVMDGGRRSYDQPPASQSERPPATDQSDPDPSLPESQFSPASNPPPVPSVARTSDLAATSDLATHSALHEVPQVQVPIPDVGPTSALTEGHPEVVEPTAPSAELLTIPEINQPQFGAGYPESEIMSRPLKIAYVIVLGVLALSLLGFAYVHLHHSSEVHSTRAAPPTTTSAHGTTTTAVLPTTLSPSADAAATALVSSWSTNNRSAALTVATPAAATTLFSVPYAGGLALARGCSTSFSPIVCTFGPPGGASPTDPIYEIMVSQVSGEWYVSSVKVEN